MLLSIVTATYNRVNLLKKNYLFLKSKKKLFKFEWVIIYERKDQKTKKFLSSIKDKFIKKIESDKKDADIAYNLGFKYAKGKYINIHGDDDFFDEHNFKMLKSILKIDKPWIIGQSEYIDKKFRKIRPLTSIIKKLLLKKYNPNILNILNFVMTPSIFFKKKNLKFVGGYDDEVKFGADYILWLNFNRYFKPLVINKVLSYVIFDNSTKTGNFNLSTYLIFLRKLKKFAKNKIFRFTQYLSIFTIIIISFVTKKVLRIY